ncbi:MAG TPA: twin-arginine translocase subunit TatC [Anaerolineae bacterium]|nr:twin-arginine translocase subunit TatC [Anaerolineae bacterium]HQI83794.1 twin-arginine translocase subunit TatC [Anaerolineae bacterium]
MSTENEMTLLDHIKELRSRLFRSVTAIIVTTLAAMLVVDYVVAWLVKPLGGATVVALSPTEAPMTYFKIALALGFGAALPYILYQIYAFIKPGLFSNERKTIPLVFPAILIFFILGALFTLQILVPISMPVLMGFFGSVITPQYSLEKYLSFVTMLLLWMGLIFQTPLVIYLIALLGIVTPKQLSQAWRIVVFVAAIFAAVITPTTDMFTMLLVTGPFVVLYFFGILLAHIAAKQRARRAAAAEAALDAE